MNKTYLDNLSSLHPDLSTQNQSHESQSERACHQLGQDGSMSLVPLIVIFNHRLSPTLLI